MEMAFNPFKYINFWLNFAKPSLQFPKIIEFFRDNFDSMDFFEYSSSITGKWIHFFTFASFICNAKKKKITLCQSEIRLIIQYDAE